MLLVPEKGGFNEYREFAKEIKEALEETGAQVEFTDLMKRFVTYGSLTLYEYTELYKFFKEWQKGNFKVGFEIKE